MYGFGDMIEKLKANPKTIVLPEGSDPRILEAASRLLAGNFIKPILLGNEEEIIKVSEDVFCGVAEGVLLVFGGIETAMEGDCQNVDYYDDANDSQQCQC